MKATVAGLPHFVAMLFDKIVLGLGWLKGSFSLRIWSLASLGNKSQISGRELEFWTI